MSNVDGVSDITGKRIFFLYPNAVIQNRIIAELAQQEYEVYTTREKDALRRLLKKYPDSVVFVDINEGMPEKDWEAWITGILEDTEIKGVSIGIVTANDDEMIKRKYLMSVKVTCGYTVLKFDLEKAVAHIFEVLQEVNAKGRRKYLRATTDKESNTTLNLPYHGEFVNGQIKDISVVGISCTLEGDPDIPKNTLIKDIQVKLQSVLLKVEGIVFGSRIDGKEKVYVFLFSQRTDPEVRTKIRKYIQQNLQTKMDEELR
jgi:hypothetical protein